MYKIDWQFLQENSDKILSDALYKITKEQPRAYHEINYNGFGNYLISHKNENYYIGEGKDVSKRLIQQFKPATSTFYKNLIKLKNKNKHPIDISIDEFKVQIIQSNIGRKEVEEFGIANLSTTLNRFQLGKRKQFNVVNQNGLWERVQEAKSEILLQAENKILNNKFNNWFDCKIENLAGLYIVKNKLNELIYIGESSNIFERFTTHSSSTYFSALRRHIGTEFFGFDLQIRNGKRKYFEVHEDREVTEFLKSCKAIFYPVHIGRYETEEYLIKKHRPILNRKDNKED